MSRLLSSTALGAAVACGLAGCQLAPRVEPAAAGVQAPPAFIEAPAQAAAAEPVAEFWRAFNDAPLDALVGQAVAANTELRVAAARIDEARALAQLADGGGRPLLDVSAGLSRSRSLDPNGARQTANAFDAGLAARWEPDLFGVHARDREAAAATLLSTEALLRAARVAVAADVARVYFEFRGLQEQLRVTRLDLQAQRQALTLVEARLSAGRGTALDAERARALVEGTAAAVPALETALVRNRLRLAVLTGQRPGAHDALLAGQRPLPALPPTALSSIGTPEALLRRRPDVAAAEAQLRAAEARSGAARGRLYPTISLNGTLGLNASRIGNLLDSGSFIYNLGASLLQGVIDQGAGQAQVSAADARRDAALAQFDQALLAALEETEGSLAAYTRAQQRSDALMRSAAAAEKAAQLALARFEAGASDFLVLLDAQREALQARDRLAQAQTAAATSLVAVYKALAGGWNTAAAGQRP